MDILSVIKELLKQTSVENEFDKYWNLSNLQYGGIKQHIEREILENKKHDSISLYRLISEGMNSFLRSYPTSPLYKAHKMKPVFLQWNKRIADKLDVKYTTEDSSSCFISEFSSNWNSYRILSKSILRD